MQNRHLELLSTAACSRAGAAFVTFKTRPGVLDARAAQSVDSRTSVKRTDSIVLQLKSATANRNGKAMPQ